ncbi:hypothetical protein MED121_04678 [Marinomonas sp. MED121]|nr:hypothetical protein MED121_04678 [Marinomonas sp. MED121]
MILKCVIGPKQVTGDSVYFDKKLIVSATVGLA